VLFPLLRAESPDSADASADAAPGPASGSDSGGKAK
jgi:hypothetical protein